VLISSEHLVERQDETILYQW